jgi:hypothetical protein
VLSPNCLGRETESETGVHPRSCDELRVEENTIRGGISQRLPDQQEVKMFRQLLQRNHSKAKRQASSTRQTASERQKHDIYLTISTMFGLLSTIPSLQQKPVGDFMTLLNVPKSHGFFRPSVISGTSSVPLCEP